MAPASPHAGAVSLATEHRTCETAPWRASWHPVNTASFNDSPQSMGLLDKPALSLANRARHETEMDQRRHQTNGQGASVLCWDVLACQFLQWRWPSCWCACWRGPVADHNRSPRLRGISDARAHARYTAAKIRRVSRAPKRNPAEAGSIFQACFLSSSTSSGCLSKTRRRLLMGLLTVIL
jgi:hypothetical protein